MMDTGLKRLLKKEREKKEKVCLLSQALYMETLGKYTEPSGETNSVLCILQVVSHVVSVGTVPTDSINGWVNPLTVRTDLILSSHVSSSNSIDSGSAGNIIYTTATLAPSTIRGTGKIGPSSSFLGGLANFFSSTCLTTTGRLTVFMSTAILILPDQVSSLSFWNTFCSSLPGMQNL